MRPASRSGELLAELVERAASVELLANDPLLKKLAQAIESVSTISQTPERYAQIARRIGELEVELVDAKIADRVSGILRHGVYSHPSLEAIVQHVDSVLRPSELERTLEQFERNLIEQLDDRRLTSQAKSVLQNRFGISEEEAHVHLRVLSRTTRKRLRDVAQALIDNPVLSAPQLQKDSRHV